MKRVSFEVAKAIKDAGYPQPSYCPQYKEDGEFENGFTDLGEGVYYAPTYLEVWLWLWREKNIYIDIDHIVSDDMIAAIKCNSECVSKYIESEDPEEAIIEAIVYIVDNDLIK